MSGALCENGAASEKVDQTLMNNEPERGICIFDEFLGYNKKITEDSQ